MTFKQFLRTIRDEDSVEGDFANDFLGHYRSKGVTISSKQKLQSYLRMCNACHEAKSAGDSCWKRYMSVKAV